MSNYVVGLFVGIESFGWNFTDFDNLIGFCKKFGINQVVLKVYEITQGDWYHNLGGSAKVVKYIEDHGLDVLAYGYFYGNNLQAESNAVKGYLSEFGKFCLNMEAEWNNNPGKTQEFVNWIGTHNGTLYISTWADPSFQNWDKNITILSKDANTIFMPEAYDDALVKDMYVQYPKMLNKIYPTFEIGNTSPAMAGPFLNFTLWEYQLARNNTKAVQDFMNVVQSNPSGDATLQYMHDIWNMNIVGASITSGIGTAWQAAFKAGKNFGYATTRELHTVTRSGDPIIVQYFSAGILAVYSTKHPTQFIDYNEKNLV